jgi:hypothetical protein
MKSQDVRLILIRLAGCGALLFLPLSGAMASPIAYASESNGGFGTIDMGTGVFTLLGNPGLELCGLGEVGGTLYGMSCGASSALYQVNPANGGLTLKGTSTINLQNFGSTLTGLFAVDTASNSYSINFSGVANSLGATGFTNFASGALSTGSSTLFYSAAPGDNTEDLYTINTSSGAATLVGVSSVGSSAAMTAMVMLGSTLYGITHGDGIDTINTGTGGVTIGPALTGEGTNLITGLAPTISSSVTPEPGTWGLAGFGIAVSILLRRLRNPAPNWPLLRPTQHNPRLPDETLPNA